MTFQYFLRLSSLCCHPEDFPALHCALYGWRHSQHLRPPWRLAVWSSLTLLSCVVFWWTVWTSRTNILLFQPNLLHVWKRLEIVLMRDINTYNLLKLAYMNSYAFKLWTDLNEFLCLWTRIVLLQCLITTKVSHIL